MNTALEIFILSLGTELTTGQTQDTNARWLADSCTLSGHHITGIEALPDRPEAIVQTIRRRAAENDVLLITGGLGPTEDDLTRQALAEVLGTTLAVDEESLDAIRRFFAVREREMPENNRIQAMIPVGAEPITNPCGTAPGIAAAWAGAQVFAMPGVPREMMRMFDEAVEPRLSRGGDRHTVRRIVCTFGATESEVGQTIADMMARGRNPDVGTTAKGGVIRVRIHAHGETEAEARALADRDVATIRNRLGRNVVGLDEIGLPHAIGELLGENGWTLATAESCTGGLVAKMLTDVPGASAWFTHGFVTYANRAKTEMLGVPASLIESDGAVSERVARAMAVGCRAAASADIAVSLTGIAGPGGGTEEKPVGLVWLGLADADGEAVTSVRCGQNQPRAEIRARAAHAALNLVRLRLLKRTEK